MKHRQRISRQSMLAQRMVDQTLRGLPADLREAAKPCTIELCSTPDENLGDDDLLGLFEGCSRADGEPQEPHELPRIRLYLDNLWDAAEGDPNIFLDEVRITLLHELGHYLGFDEDQVEALGLA